MAVPIWHASPLNNWLMATLYMGGTVVLVREYHPVHFLEAVQQQRITRCFGPPVIYTTALNAVPDFADYDLPSVRAWLYGGGPIGADVARRLVESYRTTRFYQVYGMTETGPVGAVLYPEEQLAKAGSIGRAALAGVAHVVWREPDVVGADDIRDYLSDKLARYKIPRDYVFATVLPRTPTGKIQKHLIRSAS